MARIEGIGRRDWLAGATLRLALAIAALLTVSACSFPAEEKAGYEPELGPAVPDAYIATEEACAVADGSSSLGYWEEPWPGEPAFNTEEYAHVDERGFITARLRPLSTVSADVDTASFANLRRMLRDGYALDEIPAGAVRIEELLNYLDYEYPSPKAGEAFSISARMGDCPWNDQTKLLVLGFATAEDDGRVRSKGSNLVFLIDVSGSMDSPDKLDLLKESFDVLIDSLGPDDRISIVTYADGEDIICEGVPGDRARELKRAIRRLGAGGSTNGERGLEMAYELAERNYIEGGVNRIVMASDGDLNVGMTSESELHDYVEKKRETGIYLSVLGFGSGNYKDNKMEVLADHGNGSYHYIDCVDEAERVLGGKIRANLVPFADDVKVQVEFNPAEVRGYRLLGYENREMPDEDFENDAADAGEVGPGASFTVAYEIVPADSEMELAEPELKYQQTAPVETSVAAGEWLTASLRYRSFADGEVHGQQLSVSAEDLAADPGDDWRLAAAAIELGLTLRDSAWRGEATLEDAIALLEQDPRTEGFSQEALAELLDLALAADGMVWLE